MTANETESGSPENAAGTDDSTDDQLQATTGFEAKLIEECGLEVSHVPDDMVTVRFSDDLFSGRLFIEADHADQLADELHENAEAVRDRS